MKTMYSIIFLFGRKKFVVSYFMMVIGISFLSGDFMTETLSPNSANAAYFGENSDDGVPSNRGRENNISLDQAVSDEAQVKTIAFSGLAFLTGDLCSYTFFPPGKVSDFFGFQYLRDITPNGFGHNTEFAGRISDSVLTILTDAQVQKLVDMANTQASLADDYGYKRFVLIKAFQRLLLNDLPDGAAGLDKSAVMQFTADLYAIDAAITYNRANVLGGIAAELTDSQKTELEALLVEFNTLFENTSEGGTISSDAWPVSAQNKPELPGLTVSDGPVLVSTYATQLFSWYLGSAEGDTYFCPERHGTYFGSFYMKDIPPVTAQEAVSIATDTTSSMGQAFLNALDSAQEALVTGLAEIQRTDLAGIVAKRLEISEKLRLFMHGTSSSQDEIATLIRQYGEYEGAMMYHYATNFAEVGNTLTDAQAGTLMGLRTDYYEQFPAYQADPNAYDCYGAWMYASKVDMPVIENTDFLFNSTSASDDTYIYSDDASLYPVYRFYSEALLKYFFTSDENEKAYLIANASDVWRYEGIAYYAYQDESADRLPVYRFYSETLRTHLFTVDENEKAHLIADASEIWRYEGVAFYVASGFQEGTRPVYRFYSDVLQVHLFTIDENEKNSLINTAGDVWNFEGIAYYTY